MRVEETRGKKEEEAKKANILFHFILVEIGMDEILENDVSEIA